MMFQTEVKSALTPASFLTPLQSWHLKHKCPDRAVGNNEGELNKAQNSFLNLQCGAANDVEQPDVPPIVHDVLRSPGQPLDAATRAFFEPRFGMDFSAVRMHTDAKAAESAQAVNALAYTVGHEVVFGAGQYAPQSAEGRRLIAHELTHTIQHGETSGGVQRSALSIQANDDSLEHEAEAQAERVLEGRAGSPVRMQPHAGFARLERQAVSDQTPPDLPCTFEAEFPDLSGTDVVFGLNSSGLTAKQKGEVKAFAEAWMADGANDDIRVDGFASVDGPADFNLRLSCKRAESVKKELIHQNVPEARVSLIAHGPTNEFSDSDASQNRRVVISSVSVNPPSPEPACADSTSISLAKDHLPATPAFKPEFVHGTQLVSKLLQLADRRNKRLIPDLHIPKNPLGFTLPILPVLFPDVKIPPIRVQALDTNDAACKKCAADWALIRPEVKSFVATGFSVTGTSFWIRQGNDPNVCPSHGTFGDLKEVRTVIRPGAVSKIAQGEQEHFSDAQRSFDLSGGRYLANVRRLTAERTHLRGKDQKECELKVAQFLDSVGDPGFLAAFGAQEFLDSIYGALYVRDFLEQFKLSAQRDESGSHNAKATPSDDPKHFQKPFPPSFFNNPFVCEAFWRMLDENSFPGIPGISSMSLIVDKDTPPKEIWHEL